MPKLAKDNADRWFDIFGEALDSKKLRWIITGPEKADIHANSAVTLLLRQLIPESEWDLLDANNKSARHQFRALKTKWQALQPDAARAKITAFYSYKKPKDKLI